MFFFKNRLGFVTGNTVVLSEAGEYGNFFRTSVVALLDSDRIDATVDTTKSISLEYAVYLQDSMMLFSDKAQFKLDGGRVLSPNSVQISQTSSYEINKNVRPIFMNNIIFFCAIRGNYTALMEYFVSTDDVSQAVDVSAHVDKYIPSNITSMTASPVNNMLFLTTPDEKNTIYVYKYYDEGSTRVQSAFFKWQYEADIYKVFAMGKNLNFMTKRIYNSDYSVDWIVGSGLWNDNTTWNDEGYWVDEEDDLTYIDRFEVQPIHPQEHTSKFIDVTEFIDNDTDVLYLSGTNISGALTYSFSHRLVTSVTVSLLDEFTDYTITASIKDENSIVRFETSVNSELNISRKPTEVVTSIEININDDGDLNFSGISFLSASGTDDLLSNSSFSFGVNDWEYNDWDITYNTKNIGYNVKSTISLGEWVYGSSNGVKQISGNLKMKSCIVSAEDDSQFGLIVQNVKRGTFRSIDSSYVVDKKPIIFGDSKDIRLHITDDTSSGFKITSLSLEGNYNARDRRR